MLHTPLRSEAITSPLAELRRLLIDAPPIADRRGVDSKGPREERCELCGLALASVHQHLMETVRRRIVCVCDPCAVLFDQPSRSGLRRIPRDSRMLIDFELTDSGWDALEVPISLAFFFHSTPAGRVVALYPSPGGALEAIPELDAWRNLLEQNPLVASLRPDVEALLINRLGEERGFAMPESYIVPIDGCFELVGLLRAHWRGFSGGSEAWEVIGQFFARLREQSERFSARGGGRHES